ncbi:MAG: ABC transporter transmembrane domain-containing protein, partial [Parolsenella sp.]|uniref:ABC transporter transmembrane domain-containing protein n=1 Tax=Parolsenella sp. TaxID=2083006 RepID=UPI002E789AEE
MNPYASTGSVATVTATVAGKDSLGGPNGDAGGSSSNMPTLEVTRRLLAYVGPYRGLLVASLLSAIVGVTLQLYVPILIGRGIDCMIGVGRVDFDVLVPVVRELAVVVIVASALQWVQGYCVNRLSYETVRDLRNVASDKLNRMPLSFIDSHPHGDLISRVVNDVD